MCSICGMIDWKNSENIQEETVQEMGKVQWHRGPDQQGTYTNKWVAFQHNRLAIMDVEHGLQPMHIHYQGHQYTIIYNGEIYNIPELRQKIEAEGITLSTTCDTELVLYSYILYKEECAKYLNGIFAFAIFDEKQHQVYFARDRFGVKPLFYTQVGTTLLFASEIKSLLKHPKVKPIVNQQGLWQLLYLSPNKIEGSSVFRDIKEVLPATCGYASEAGFNLHKYWELQAELFEDTREEAIEKTKAVLTDAIKKQLVSDVPLATLLSGGIDSSIISSVAARVYQERGEVLGTYSFEYAGNSQNFHGNKFQPESDDLYARYMAHFLNTNHKVLQATNEKLITGLKDAMYYRDLPGMADIDSSLFYYCSEIKKDHTVVLSGECADEVFGGYPWFYREEMLGTGFFPWIHAPKKRVQLFRGELAKVDEGFEYMKGIYQNSIANCPMLETDDAIMRQSRIATWLSVNYFMVGLLERKDRMSMASGVEVRVPFADHRILEYVFNVPMSIKFENNVEKALLREAMGEYLPDKILHRKKSPYPKTHDPRYSQAVEGTLKEIIKNKESHLAHILDKKMITSFLGEDDATWFGQLMSKPQLMAWLIQLEMWFEAYHIELQL